MRDYRAELAAGGCKENHGCNMATICLCALAEDMVDEIERLRMPIAELVAANELLRTAASQLVAQMDIMHARGETFTAGVSVACSRLRELLK